MVRFVLDPAWSNEDSGLRRHPESRNAEIDASGQLSPGPGALVRTPRWGACTASAIASRRWDDCCSSSAASRRSPCPTSDGPPGRSRWTILPCPYLRSKTKLLPASLQVASAADRPRSDSFWSSRWRSRPLDVFVCEANALRRPNGALVLMFMFDRRFDTPSRRSRSSSVVQRGKLVAACGRRHRVACDDPHPR